MTSTPRAQPKLNATAIWYLQCFEQLAKHLGKSPSIDQFAVYIGRDVSTAWRQLNRLAAGGFLRKTKRGRFVVVARKPAKNRAGTTHH